MNMMESKKDLKETDLRLMNEPTILIYPSLAVALSVSEAIVLSKLERLLETSLVTSDGYKWVKQSYDNWQKHFPFWSSRTISRMILKLEEQGYLLSTIKFNDYLTDKTKWYRIDYEKLDQLLYSL